MLANISEDKIEGGYVLNMSTELTMEVSKGYVN